ncbi:DUF5808 domain-containing protein [Cellulomonas rhizosphaerae]|uniref:DUF5808 domain-containing protein n=1 Tax=Cellulomonas rhizosphaerae TaxID=2293719 RepID=A0A413RII8_9CELL|nr:DUF5808 domain-containing protein [Cellulomonas rhizosphaerae]RHA38158.1 hypothetical protein D1825_14740 [Cellulomonas rhizosphaerae]
MTSDKHSKGPRDIQRLIRLATFGLAVAAIVKEVRTPAEEREWHGVVVGFVPYDFRIPTIARLKKRMWDPESSHVINPRVFGVGWTVNLGKVVSVARQQIGS